MTSLVIWKIEINWMWTCHFGGIIFPAWSVPCGRDMSVRPPLSSLSGKISSCLVRQNRAGLAIVRLWRGSQSNFIVTQERRVSTIKCGTDHYYTPIVSLVSIHSIAICFNSKFVSPFKVNTVYRQHLEEQSLVESFKLRSTNTLHSPAKAKYLNDWMFWRSSSQKLISCKILLAHHLIPPRQVWVGLLN